VGVHVASGGALAAKNNISIQGSAQSSGEPGISINDTLTSTNGGSITLGTDQGDILVNSGGISGAALNLYGSATADTLFEIAAPIPFPNIQINGGGGTNTLSFLNFTAGNVDVGVDQLTGITNLVGSSTGTNDTVFGSDVNDGTFTVTGPDLINYSSWSHSISISRFENITGGASDEMFVIHNNASNLSGNLDGGGHTVADTLDYAYGAGTISNVTVDLGNSTATGITGTFSNIENFIGSAGLDDQFTGSTTTNAIDITGSNEFESTGIFTARGFENLISGEIDTVFSFLPGGFLDGNLEGNGLSTTPTSNSINYQAFGSLVEVDLENATATGVGLNFFNIENFRGSTENTDRIFLFDTNDLIEINNDNSGLVNGTTFFTDFENVNSGPGIDQFNFNGLVTFSGFIDGGNNADFLSITIPPPTPPTFGPPTPPVNHTAFIGEGVISINPTWNFGNFETVRLQMGPGNDTVTTQFTSFNQVLDGGNGIDTLNFSQAPFGSRSPVTRGGSGAVYFSAFEILRFAPGPSGEEFSPVPEDDIPLPDFPDSGDLLQIQLQNANQNPDGIGSGLITFTEATGGGGLSSLQNILGNFGAITQQTIILGGLDGDGMIVLQPLSLDGTGIQPSNLGLQLLQQSLAPDANVELLSALGLDLGIFLINPDGPFAIDLSGPPINLPTLQNLLAQLSPMAQADLLLALELAVVVSLTPVDGPAALDSSGAQPGQATILLFNNNLGEAALNELNAALGIQ
ncbi:MAG: hypothetical protein HKN23_22010, partial [Verrucomicrobiales bacterium]|nr:hypothetical protein [Verrucomicrobiales bacterium]